MTTRWRLAASPGSRFDGVRVGPGSHQSEHFLEFIAHDPDDRHGTYLEVHGWVAHATTRHDADAPRSATAPIRAAVAHLEQLLAGTTSTPPSRVEIDADHDDFKRLEQAKRCRHQLRTTNGLACSVGDPTRDSGLSADRSIERRTVPVSAMTCLNCPMPDTDYECAALSHVSMDFDEGWDADFVYQACELGNANVEKPSRCHIAGHDCAHRWVDVQVRSRTPASPMALPEALDFLDAIWRLAFDGERLLGPGAGVTHAAALAQPCVDREGVAQALSAFVDIVDRWKIPAPEMEAGTAAPRGSMDRLRLLLPQRLEPAGAERALEAIDKIQAVLDLRNATQHSDAARKLPSALSRLGISHPPVWATIWDQVRDELVVALAVLRDELRRLSG